jgi:hypothetical protein
MLLNLGHKFKYLSNHADTQKKLIYIYRERGGEGGEREK